MTTAREILDRDPLVVQADMAVAELADLLLTTEEEGVCVLEDGRLVGVVTAMDLVFKEKNVHLPTILTFMEAVIPLGMKRAEAELEKISSLTVRELMTKEPITVGLDTDLHDMATMMVEQHLTMLPVIDQGRLVGVVDKRDVLKAAFPRR